MGYLRAIAGDLDAHERIARQVLAEAESVGDGPIMLQAICSLNWALQVTGRISETQALMQRGLALARQEGRSYRITYLLAQQGYAHALLGPDPRSALPRSPTRSPPKPAYLDTLLPDFRDDDQLARWRSAHAVAAMRQS